MAYTSEDFERALDSHNGKISACVDYLAIVRAALSIASAVMRPGAIEDALATTLGRSTMTYRTPGIMAHAAIIRAALADAKP